MSDADDTVSTDGWDAIDGALARIYGDAEPMHWGTVIKFRLGGPDPLDGISAYPRTEPVPHWHFVSYGLTELYDKESDNADESGWGFELTFRLVRDPADTEPPVWVASMLQNLARYVFSTGNWFDDGHHMNINGPIAVSREDSAIRAIAFTVDPELGAIDTPHGAMKFLQVVGLTLDELDACQRWNPTSVLGLVEPSIPLYVTDVDRGSLVADPQVAAAVRAGVERDGSSSGVLAVTTADWDLDAETGTTTIRLGALHAQTIAEMLRGRLGHGNDLVLHAEDTRMWFAPSERWEASEPQPGVLQLGLPAAAVDEVAATLRPQVSRTPIASAPGLTVEIVPTVMRDEHGNETGQVVG